MKKYLRKARSAARKTWRGLAAVQKWENHKKFRLERKLLKGSTVPTSNKPSVIHYSVNKAATQFTKTIMLRCGEQNSLVPARFSDYAWISTTPYLFTLSKEEVKPYLKVFRPEGILYTVFGGLVEDVPDIEKYRTVIMIRDPRDVLVSGYYSYSTSHKVPDTEEKAKEFLEFREKIKNTSVDDYVIEMCENTKWRMSQYIELSKATSSVCILRYEDMIADFRTWFDTLLNHCEWQIDDQLRNTIIAQAEKSSNPQQEDVSNHRRQVTPGDYERKLQPQTIDYLNDQLAEALETFGYR